MRQLAMRRTMFGFPRDLLPAALGAPSARVAEAHRRRFVKAVEANGWHRDGQSWLSSACDAVAAALAEAPEGLTTTQIRERVPIIDRKISMSPESKWGGDVAVAPWVLTQLGSDGRIVRGANALPWNRSRYLWRLMDDWLGGSVEPLAEREGYAEIVGRYLFSFGPVTATDVQWWLGSTKRAVTHALADVDARPVRLDGCDEAGWLLPDDLEPVDPPDDWAALLPVLDPSTMGWKQRGFYLAAEDQPYLFDSVGNGGTTAWLNGRIVGCWAQDAAGTVRVVPRGRLSRTAQVLLDQEAERLTAWLDGLVITNTYSSLQMKQARLP